MIRTPAPTVACAALVIGVEVVVYALFAARIPLSGDEAFYVASAVSILGAIRDLAHLDAAAAAEQLRHVVARGWFTPGLSIVLAPAMLVSASIPFLRLYLGVLNGVAVCAILRRLVGDCGARAAWLYGICALLVPYYPLFFFLIWGDLLAAHLLLLLFFFVLRRRAFALAGAAPFRAAVHLGVCLGLITWLRGFYWIFLPVFVVLIFLQTDAIAALRARLARTVALGIAAAAALLAILAPWTIAVSRQFGPHLTTTSTVLSQIILFGSDEYRRSLPPSLGIFDGVYSTITSHAEASGRTYGAQARIELAAATAGVPREEKLARIARNLRAFFLDSEEFLGRFQRLSRPPAATGPAWRELAFEGLIAVNHWGWRLLLMAGALLYFVPLASAAAPRFVTVVYKCVVALFSLHPFVVLAHGRYYVEYVPFVASALVWVVGNAAAPAGPTPAVDRWLVLIVQLAATIVGAAILFIYATHA